MTDPETSRHIELKDEEDRTTAVAEVSVESGPEGTVRTSLYAKSEHVRPGDRSNLVDTVMDLPEVQGSERVEATVPFGDAESVERLRKRTEEAVLRAAGATTLLDANVPHSREAEPAESPTESPARPSPGEQSARPSPGEQPPAQA
jgi:hypothetical protein